MRSPLRGSKMEMGKVRDFYKAVLAANEYPGPAVIICYTTCQPEHGVPDDASITQSKLVVGPSSHLAGLRPRSG